MALSIIIEKDIALGIPSDDPGESEIVDLNGADRFSCHAIYVDDSSSGATLDFQCSNDGINFVNIQAQTAISSSGQVMLEQANVEYRYFKVVKDIASGDLDLKLLVFVIGDSI